jgi:hypothetical protein
MRGLRLIGSRNHGAPARRASRGVVHVPSPRSVRVDRRLTFPRRQIEFRGPSGASRPLGQVNVTSAQHGSGCLKVEQRLPDDWQTAAPTGWRLADGVSRGYWTAPSAETCSSPWINFRRSWLCGLYGHFEDRALDGGDGGDDSRSRRGAWPPSLQPLSRESRGANCCAFGWRVSAVAAGYVGGVKWLFRGIMGVALANFAASIWFAQYIITGWLIALYVLGSFALALVSTLWVE